MPFSSIVMYPTPLHRWQLGMQEQMVACVYSPFATVMYPSPLQVGQLTLGDGSKGEFIVKPDSMHSKSFVQKITGTENANGLLQPLPQLLAIEMQKEYSVNLITLLLPVG